MLRNDTFVEEMNEFIQNWNPPQELDSPTSRWEWLKHEVNNFVRQFQKENKNEELQILKNLERDLRESTTRRDKGEPGLDFPIESITRQIRELEENRARRRIFKSKANWSLYGEKPSKFFLNIQKRRIKENTISSLISSEGTLLTDHREILQEGRAFYETLYKSREQDETPFEEIEPNIALLPLPQLSTEGKQALEAPLTIEELKNAADKLNKDKSPPGSIPAEEF